MFLITITCSGRYNHTAWVKGVRLRDTFDHTVPIVLHIQEGGLLICSNMDGLRDYHTKGCKSDRERQTSYDTTYMWNLKTNNINELTKQKQTHRHRKQTRKSRGGTN